ncbi:MAG TPA: NAD(P)H-hydrate dehydratase [Chitinophagaceae bacterium]|nr:NAD(P)H-hydrate dehydratase [Chitinophagaceae bacterium]
MKIFNAEQIRKWDAYTIAHEPVSSINLMERAATACYDWLIKDFIPNRTTSKESYKIFCGKGNNGGDGLAIARKLLQNGKKVNTYVLESDYQGTEDFQTNLQRLQALTTDIHYIKSPAFFPIIEKTDIVIDAILGTGLNKPLAGLISELSEHINYSGATVIAIDIPTGMFADKSCKNNVTINASYTLSFQQYKLCFLLSENEQRVGMVQILDIGLHKDFYKNEPALLGIVDESLIKNIYKPRKKFSHKGDYGHAALITGSLGMMGASTLCAEACMRSGAGKLTCYIPKCGYEIMQLAVPEAMCKISGSSDYLENIEMRTEHDAIGIGPGIGLYPSLIKVIEAVFTSTQKPLIVDADALNLLSSNKSLLSKLPVYSILSPHPKEFERLFGETENDFDRLDTAIEKARQYNCYIVLKGHYTFIACPDGKGYFNNTGNAGMATGGSGDVLTGVIAGLLAQGYTPIESSVMGVYLHGMAGDLAAKKNSQEAMIARDIINYLGKAFSKIASLQ